MAYTPAVIALLIVAWVATRSLRRDLRRAASEAWREMRAKWAAGGRLQRIGNGLGMLALFAVVAGLAPWPITVTGPFIVASAVPGILVAPDSGVVVDVMVREGSRVDPGRSLMLIRNLELEREVAATALAVDSLGLLATRARARGDEGTAGQITAQAQAEGARLAGMRERVRSLVIRAPVAGVVASPRPDTLLGRTISLGDTLLHLTGERVEARIALQGAGASLAREGQRVAEQPTIVRPLGLSILTVPLGGSVIFVGLLGVVSPPVSSVAPSATPDGMVETRVRLAGTVALRPGMTGDARITLRESNVWGALWWAIRSRIRTDVLL